MPRSTGPDRQFRASAMDTGERQVERRILIGAWGAAVADPECPADVLAQFELNMYLLELGDQVDAATGLDDFWVGWL